MSLTAMSLMVAIASSTIVVAALTVSTTRAAATVDTAATAEKMMTVEMKVEEDKKGKVKGFPLSKQVGIVLERENKLFLGRK